MKRQDVINNIMNNYGSEVDLGLLNSQIDSGEEQGFSYQTIYTGLRMALATLTGKQEYFTSVEIAEAMGMTQEEINEQIEEMGKELVAAGENPDDYFREIKPEKAQRFVIMPGGLDS